MRVNVDGTRPTHLRFADVIVMFADNITDLDKMLSELDSESSKIGLKINESKLKIMNQEETRITHTIENIQEYSYMGQIIEMGKGKMEAEIERIRRLGWAAFGKPSNVLNNKMIPQYLRTRIFNQCVPTVITYGALTWTLTKTIVNKQHKGLWKGP